MCDILDEVPLLQKQVKTHTHTHSESLIFHVYISQNCISFIENPLQSQLLTLKTEVLR